MDAIVVVGYDESPASQEALEAAAQEAELRGAELVLVHAFHWVVPASPVSVVPRDLEEGCREAAELIAARGLMHARARHPDLRVRTHTVAGDASDTVTTAAADADLLVVGTRGRGGFQGLLLGSVAQRIVAKAPCPVLVTRARTAEPRGRVLAALDVAEDNAELLEFAFGEAERRGLALHALHVWGDPWSRDYDVREDAVAAAKRTIEDLEQRTADSLRPFRDRFAHVSADAVVYTGSIGKLLVQASSTADLVVVGARRQRHAGGMKPGGMRIGPAAHTLLMHSECPVALVPID
jgi:nucleotide-binding universal stress UspA family protein